MNTFPMVNDEISVKIFVGFKPYPCRARILEIDDSERKRVRVFVLEAPGPSRLRGRTRWLTKFVLEDPTTQLLMGGKPA